MVQCLLKGLKLLLMHLSEPRVLLPTSLHRYAHPPSTIQRTAITIVFPIQTMAMKILHEKLGYDQIAYYLILPEVYKYWMQKRESIGKALCRRYWPLVPATDADPYQVFRVRDKERYRLRRQQKRNDVESFRYVLFLSMDKLALDSCSMIWGLASHS
jgi:hypothetical protein